MEENRPRILLMADGPIGLKMAQYLATRNEHVCSLVVENAKDNQWSQQIIDSLELQPNAVFHPEILKDPNGKECLAEFKPDILLTITWSHILPGEIIEIARRVALNIHNGLLPYNRGWHSNVWAIREGTPSGVTIHHLDPGIDTGDIAYQLEVEATSTDTGASLYRRLQNAMWELLEASWPRIVTGDIPRIPQQVADATHHYKKELTIDDEIDLEREYRACDLINLIRARSFAPHPGAYFVKDGQKVFVRMDLQSEKKPAEPAEAPEGIRRAG